MGEEERIGLPPPLYILLYILLMRVKPTLQGDNAAGDVGLGQGGFNPFGFAYTQEEYEEKQLQEIKHCRLVGCMGGEGEPQLKPPRACARPH